MVVWTHKLIANVKSFNALIEYYNIRYLGIISNTYSN